MRFSFTLLLLFTAPASVFCQGNVDYYSPMFPRPVGSNAYTPEAFLKRFGEEKVYNRWYFGVDGFVRTDKNRLTNTFDELISTESPAAYGWSAVVGWVGNEDWGIEAEYARSAIHNVLLINEDNSLHYKFTNDKNSLMLRGKRRLLFGKTSLRRSAFWIGAGVGIVPNSGKQMEYREFYGYRQKGRWQGVDTLAMTSDTRTNPHATGFAEANLEYVVKIAKGVDMSFFTRKQWGFANSLTTTLEYYVNQQKTQTAVIQGDGSGWKFGVSLRYVFLIGKGLENLNLKYDEE